MSFRIVVVGRKGQVAQALAARAGDFPGLAVDCAGRPHLDLEDRGATEATLAAMAPQLIVNAAAFTDVDGAEAAPERAFAINRDGAAAVARAACRLGIPLIHLSTDYVFSGGKDTAYVEEDETGPVNAYGAAKLAGEEAVRAAHSGALILRTSWVHGLSPGNFVANLLRQAARGEALRVVADQRGSPTAAGDLAAAVLRIAPGLSAEAGGLFHFAGAGGASRYDLACHVMAVSRRLGGPAAAIAAAGSAEQPRPARRPANSELSSAAFARHFGFAPSHWQAAAADTVRQLLAGGATQWR